MRILNPFINPPLLFEGGLNWNLILTALTLVLTALALGVILLQLRLMQRQDAIIRG